MSVLLSAQSEGGQICWVWSFSEIFLCKLEINEALVVQSLK